MLEHDPRPGTRVVFACEIRTPLFKTARAFESALLVRKLDSPPTPGPDDRFEIEYQCERLVVRREDIGLPLGT